MSIYTNVPSMSPEHPTESQVLVTTECWYLFIYIYILYIGGVPQMAVPQNCWFVKENLIKIDDWGVPPILGHLHISTIYGLPQIIQVIRPWHCIDTTGDLGIPHFQNHPSAILYFKNPQMASLDCWVSHIIAYDVYANGSKTVRAFLRFFLAGCLEHF